LHPQKTSGGEKRGKQPRKSWSKAVTGERRHQMANKANGIHRTDKDEKGVGKGSTAERAKDWGFGRPQGDQGAIGGDSPQTASFTRPTKEKNKNQGSPAKGPKVSEVTKIGVDVSSVGQTKKPNAIRRRGGGRRKKNWPTSVDTSLEITLGVRGSPPGQEVGPRKHRNGRKTKCVAAHRWK